MQKIPFLIILFIGISLVPFSSAESIPEWVKNNASWWAERQISQTEFITGLEFLINEGIIYIPPTEPGIPGPEKIIPDWVRHTAGWWADNKIPNSEFINAMKYLIEIGIIEVDATSPEISEEEISNKQSETPVVSGKPLNMILEGYSHVAADGRFILDVKIFDAEIYSGTKFGGNSGATLDGVQIDISLFNEENELIHTYNAFTENGLVRYDVIAKETSQDGTLWMINNLYTVNIIAFLNDQSVEKNYEFYGQASAYSYNAGSAIRPPTELTATAGNDQVTLSWTAPKGVKGITDYKIQYSTDGSTWNSFSHNASDVVTDGTETDVVDGLEDSTLYYFRVAAINYSGDGKYSSIVSATTT
tara:strand:+ start:269 stop:1348 length:1080 start_codon:yes stop_codon:yes gene_type:complete